jgi:Multicopper oxidase
MGSGAGRYNGQELNATSPLQRDTVLIPAYSWTVLRFVTDNRERPSFTWNYVM